MKRGPLPLIGALVFSALPALAGDRTEIVRKIADPEIRAGVEAAINRNVIPAATQRYYPGFFEITADGGAFGGGATWPGLDSWQMAGAYLLLGRTQLVLDYFDYVRSSQRKDGAIPFAIFPGNTPSNHYLNFRYPEDLFTYHPPKRDGVDAAAQESRSWIGLFVHWQPKANPLSVLGTICYILTAHEIYDSTRSVPWLTERVGSVEAAAREVLSRKGSNGLIGGSGFYTELPPRFGWDGITQCFAIRAFREMARLCRATGNSEGENTWTAHAAELTQAFTTTFWRDDHYAEYVHAERGLVDAHGLSDVNWAAIAFGIADDAKVKVLWPRLLAEPGFRHGNMPTLTVTKPFSYEKWEYNEPLSFEVSPLNDVASMGRAWYLEALACQRMRAWDRLVESTRLVCRAASDGYWRERYHPQADGSTKPAGAQKYCEYAAILTRVVLTNPDVFCRLPSRCAARPLFDSPSRRFLGSKGDEWLPGMD